MAPYRLLGALVLTFVTALPFDSYSAPPRALPDATLVNAESKDYVSADPRSFNDYYLEEPPELPAPDPLQGLTPEEIAALQVVEAQPVAQLASTRPAPGAAAAPVIVAKQSSGLGSVTNGESIATAQALLGIPYIWGGNTNAGMDCSAWDSRTWGVSRQTTDTLYRVAYAISKEEMVPDDAMNLTRSADPRGYGHIRLFAAWANGEQGRMWVYEETPRQAIYHAIPYDARYTPMRRLNFESDALSR